MNKVAILTATVAACGTMAATAAWAQNGWYFSGFGGADVRSNFTTSTPISGSPYSINTSSKTGYALGLAVGKEFLPNWRGELELSYDSAGLSKGTVSYKGASGVFPFSGSMGITYLMGNIWYDLPIGGHWRPYVGGGLGAAFASSSSPLGGSGTVFAAQFGAGVGIDVTPNMTLDVGYRLKDAFNVKSKFSSSSATFSNFDVVDNVFQVGARFHF